MLQTVVKKWFRDKDSGFLATGTGKDIIFYKAALINCQFLKVGVNVEFECHVDKRGLIAKKVKLLAQNKSNQRHNHVNKPFRPGVMT